MTLAPIPALAAGTAYAPPRHLAPCDLDLSGAQSWIVDKSNHYPNALPVEAALAARFDVTPDRVLVTAGADEALDRCCRAMLTAGRNAIVTDPTFEMIPRYVGLTGAELRSVPWTLGDWPVEEVMRTADGATALVAIVTPNNPTGLVASTDAIRRVHDALPSALIVVDLAYVEFAAHDPTAELLGLPRVVIVRTFSKAWGMPDARVGYAIGAANTIAWLRRAGGPFAVATTSLQSALDALDTGEGRMRATVAAVRSNRGALEARLNDLGACALPGEGNFVCVVGDRAGWLRDALAGLGVATRFFPAKDRELLRITMPVDPAAFSRLVAATESALAPEAVLFDLDGVIADVSRSYREAIRQTAVSFGVTLTPAQIAARKAAGNANDDWTVTADLIRAGGVSCDLTDVTAEFERRYQGSNAIPGLRELESSLVPAEWLRELSARIPLAVVTGRPRTDADCFLRRFDLLSCFATVVAREDAELKPSPAPVIEALRRLGVRRAWMLGDTPDDVVSARAAGVVPIGIGSVTGAARNITNPTEITSWLP